MVEALVGVELQVSLLLAVALVGYVLASRIGQSVVIAEILLGIVIGPSLLGWVTYTEIIRVLAQFGAIFLLFAVGLESSFKEIYNLRSFTVALFGVVIPWLGGFFLSELFGYGMAESVFVGTALTATSIAITANVLREMSMLETRTAKLVIGAAVVDDVLGLLALSLTNEFVSGAILLGPLLVKVFIVLLFLAVGAFSGRILSKVLWLLDSVAKSKELHQMTFVFAMAIAFLYSAVAELIGLSGIVGAFVAGVSLANLKIPVLKEGARYLEMIFAAIFFVSLGILIDLNAVGAVGLFLVALTAVAFLTKIAGCGIAARIFGASGRESLLVGVGMAPRGEVAMIIALVGLGAGVIGQGIYSAIVLMSLLTTLFTPFFLKRLFGGAKKIQ